jgi:hypothetical protein
VTVRLDPVQRAWLEAIADVKQCTWADAMREALSWLAARETMRVSRTRHYEIIALASRAETWDPITGYISASDRHRR